MHLDITDGILGVIIAMFGWLLKKYADKTDRNEIDNVKAAQILSDIEKRMANRDKEIEKRMDERDKEIERHRAALHAHGDDIQTILTLHHIKGCDSPVR